MDTSFHTIRRRLSAALRETTSPGDAPRPLEVSERGAREAPAVREATLIEGKAQSARAVPGVPEARFEAFLDGSQLTLVASWQGAIPIVHGTVSAVVRRRHERRLTTWGAPVVRRALYAPIPLLPAETARALDDLGIDVVDTMARRDPDSTHPFALQDLAYQRVLADRERVEQELARRWCESEPGLLFVDGGISGDATVAKAANVVGVVKTHQSMYASADDLGLIAGLQPGQRAGVVRIDPTGSRVPGPASQVPGPASQVPGPASQVPGPGSRVPVSSWYLRTMGAAGRDPFWGLVRIEVPDIATKAAVAKRADEVSRWVLAERLPLSVPDPRWDRMAYGVRDAEEYLRAVQ